MEVRNHKNLLGLLNTSHKRRYQICREPERNLRIRLRRMYVDVIQPCQPQQNAMNALREREDYRTILPRQDDANSATHAATAASG